MSLSELWLLSELKSYLSWLLLILSLLTMSQVVRLLTAMWPCVVGKVVAVVEIVVEPVVVGDVVVSVVVPVVVVDVA